ncbi:MAG: DinB family protein [Chitinophagaceae bacterium]|nr:MAG: DinB family protein [Chitinophagaceae bacterium]
MSVLELLIQEFEQEAATTRKMLSRVPDNKFDWKPHPKSMDVKTLATHIAELPTWISLAMNTDELDFATGNYTPQPINSTQDLLDYLEKNLGIGRSTLANADPSKFEERWVLRTADQIHVDTNRYGLIRISLSQIIHHRAQLGVFLRILDVPIPGSYGPSADEMNF